MRKWISGILQEAFIEMIEDEWRAYRYWMARRGEQEMIEFPKFVRERMAQL